MNAMKVHSGVSAKDIRQRVLACAARKWGALTDVQRNRLNQELNVFEKRGWLGYVVLIADIVNAIHAGGGILGPGRGVAASSAVYYAIGAVDVDPLEYRLFFERYLAGSVTRPMPVMFNVDSVGLCAASAYLARNREHLIFKIEKHPNLTSVKVDDYEFGFWHEYVLDRFATVKVTAERKHGHPFVIEQNDESVYETIRRGDAADITGHDSACARVFFSGLNHVLLEDFANFIVLKQEQFKDDRKSYVERVNGSVSIPFKHPNLPHFLGASGQFLFEEDVVLVAHYLAGLSLKDAVRLARVTRLRESINFAKELEEWHQRFVDGCCAYPDFNLLPDHNEQEVRNIAEDIWNDVIDRSEFRLSKAHALCVAKLGYAIAYVKAHYPNEWADVKKYD